MNKYNEKYITQNYLYCVNGDVTGITEVTDVNRATMQQQRPKPITGTKQTITKTS